MNVIYTDNNATTKVAEEVIEEMLPYFGEYYGNPSSMHTFGDQVGKKTQAGPAAGGGSDSCGSGRNRVHLLRHGK